MFGSSRYLSIIKMECVYCAVRTESLYIIHVKFRPQRLINSSGS